LGSKYRILVAEEDESFLARSCTCWRRTAASRSPDRRATA
jgi:hypothetical protein